MFKTLYPLLVALILFGSAAFASLSTFTKLPHTDEGAPAVLSSPKAVWIKIHLSAPQDH